jgi:hypothetical protein
LQVLNITFDHPQLIAKGVRILLLILTDYFVYVKKHFGHLVTIVNTFITNDANGKVSCQLIAKLTGVSKILTDSEWEDWINLFETFSQCVHHRAKPVRAAVEQAFIAIVAQSGNCFNDQVWTYIFRDTLSAFFQFQNTSPDHFPTLLTDLFQRIIEPSIARLMDYIEYIFALLRKCFDVSSLQTVALTCVLRLVHASPESFGSDPALSRLLSLLVGILPRVVQLVFCVEVFADLVTIFADTPIVNRFVELIGALVNECSKQPTAPGCVACWCAARGEYFRWIAKLRWDAVAAEHFRETLTLAMEHRDPEFEKLVTAELAEVRTLENEAFATVSEAAQDLLCDFIEFGDAEIRLALRPIIARGLGL